ncbi:RICIN domain-containing protein [Streptomyces malaysiensis]
MPGPTVWLSLFTLAGLLAYSDTTGPDPTARARPPRPASPLSPVRGLALALRWPPLVRGQAEDSFGQLGADAFDLAAGGVPFGDDRRQKQRRQGRRAVGGANQQWRAVDEDGGAYHFVNRNSGKCLDVPGASTQDGVRLQQYTCDGSAAQSFQVAEVPDTPGVRFHHMVTVSLGGTGTISHVINNTGGPSNSGSNVANLVNYP